MKKLLEKIRRLNHLIQKNAALPLDFDALSKVVSHCVEASTYILGSDATLLGHSMDDMQICVTMTDIVNCGGKFPANYNNELLDIQETAVNIQRHGICTFYPSRKCHLGNKYSTVVPIIGGGERLGSLVLSKLSEFYDDDVLLAEYCGTVVGMEMIRSQAEKSAKVSREKAGIAVAMKALSHSEIQAVLRIFEDFQENDSIIIASKIAKKADITRSVIVNALRKLESAGVIEVSSLGVKGTHIKVVNDYLLEELSELQFKLI